MRLLRLPEVLAKVSLGRATLYRMMKSGEFPMPVKVRHMSMWPEEEVDAWITACIHLYR